MAEALENALLAAVAASECVFTPHFADSQGLDHQQVVGVMKSLEAEGYLLCKMQQSERNVLTADAQDILQNGSPEYRVLAAMPIEGVDDAGMDALLSKEVVAVGKGRAMKNKWIARDKASGKYTKIVEGMPSDELVQQLQAVAAGSPLDDKTLKDLKARKLIDVVKLTAFQASKGPAFALQRKKLHADITKEMLDSGSWASEAFKKYNFDSAGQAPGGGHLHALMKVRAEFRSILLELGFQEMPTNKFVESSFWNFDALFQPQSHPTRDMHDTFFLKAPAATLRLPEDYLAKVKAVHESGGYGSVGYGYSWKREEAEKNLLRTHTTAVSARMLHALANQPGGFKPVRYFSIDRVFRNETLDATHLAEFHQVEGVVADYDLSLGDLIGIISEFFKRIGITELRFKPAFNPYTEPSMEVFGYHPDLKKWTEIGNSGIFRPEMLLPMGLPPGVRVIAWGLSLERPTMIKYRYKNIRELFGHKVKFDMSRAAPIARF